MIDQLTLDKQLYIFELDNVLFPRKDYLLQVYYLFGSFYEFTEGTAKANEIAQFMTKIYNIHGEEAVFPATKTIYNLDDKYEENYHRLMANAQLPLKLLLFPEIEEFLLKLNKQNKQIGILTKGNPVEQLNKLKFIDWGKAEVTKERLKIYFADELDFRSISPLEFIAEDYNIAPSELIYIEQL